MRSRPVAVIIPLVMTFLISTQAYAQMNGVAALQTRLMTPPGTTVLNVPTLGLSKLNHADVRIRKGQIELRMANTLITPDEIVHRNDVLIVRKVEGSSEKNNDYLRITVASERGAFAPLAFELPKGTLSGMDETALEQLIAPVLGLLVTSSGSPNTASNRSDLAAASPFRTTTTGSEKQSSAPRPPQHRSTDVDLPPAAPGYPPMHAAQPAGDGCWYESYLSQTFSVEVAYQQCPAASSTGAQVVVKDGQDSVIETSSNQEEPLELFKIYTKRFDEPLKEAVKRLVIARFKDPASHLGCTAVHSINPQISQPTVEIGAIGAYAKRKSFPAGKNGMECDGYMSSEDGSYYFTEFPSESKVKFIGISDGKGDAIFPPETIHFAATSSSSASPELHKSGEVKPPVASAKTLKSKLEHSSPVRGVWSVDEAMYDSETNETAATMGTYDTNLTGNLQAVTYVVACAGTKVNPSLELRVLLPAPNGYDPSSIGKTAHLQIGSIRREAAQVGSRPFAQGYYLLVLPLTGQEAQLMSGNVVGIREGISILFYEGIHRGVTTAQLPPGNEAIDSVLTMCHIPVASRDAQDRF